MYSHEQPNFADRHIGPDRPGLATVLGRALGVDTSRERRREHERQEQRDAKRTHQWCSPAARGRWPVWS